MPSNNIIRASVFVHLGGPSPLRVSARGDSVKSAATALDATLAAMRVIGCEVVRADDDRIRPAFETVLLGGRTSPDRFIPVSQRAVRRAFGK